jgi:hypothetical protein
MLDKQVKIRIVAEKETEISTAQVRKHKPIFATDLLVDEREALIAMPDYSACGWTDNPVITKHFKEFLELVWNHSTES